MANEEGDFSGIRKITEKVDGFLSEAEGRTLFGLAKECSTKGLVVEIGSWKGKSTIWLAKGSKAGKGAKVVAIDPHTGSPEHGKVNTLQEFRRNIKGAGVEAMVRPIVKTSEGAAKGFKGKIGLLFIDGNHDYEFVKNDLKLWWDKVKPGGYLCGHDYDLYDVSKAVVEFSNNKKLKPTLGGYPIDWWIVKPELPKKK